MFVVVAAFLKKEGGVISGNQEVEDVGGVAEKHDARVAAVGADFLVKVVENAELVKIS